MGIIPQDVRDLADRAAARYAALDPEDRMRVHVDGGFPATHADARVLLDRLDGRDGCHFRETTLRAAVVAFLHVLDTTTRPAQPAVDDAADRLRAALADTAHPKRGE